MFPPESCDVVVVGAGLAGLSAAYELARNGRHVLILEATARPGGKLWSVSRDGVSFERGALFAYSPDWLPFPVDGGDCYQEAPLAVGLFLGHLTTGPTVVSCLHQRGWGLRDVLHLEHLIAGPSLSPTLLSPQRYASLNAFFQIIHPGELRDTVPERRLDSLTEHRIAHYAGGNESLVDAFLKNTRAELRTCHRVTGLRPEAQGVRVHYENAAGPGEIHAAWVVLAAPAEAAAGLLSGARNVATDFLNRVRYGSGIVVTLGLQRTNLIRLSYVVSPAGLVNTFLFRHETGQDETLTVTAYLVGDKASAAWARPDAELVNLVMDELNALTLGCVAADSLLFSDVHRWPAVGPLIVPNTYEDFCRASRYPASRILLAGDYTRWDEAKMPYGMEAALASGRHAAAMLLEHPEGVPVTRFSPRPLAITTVSTLSAKGPEIVSAHEDGTIAYYGLLLQDQGDEEMERYLLAEAEEGLWSYQQDYGVTSLDSALVMEGLWSTQRHQALLAHSADRLVATFFDPQAGGFNTIPASRVGRAGYWPGADCLATAYCGWLLGQIDPGRHATTIEACARYLKKKQLVSGKWPGKWFTSETIPVFYAVRLLAAIHGPEDESCRRAHTWLLGMQHHNGAWQHAVIETAAAVQALISLRSPLDPIERGCRWLRHQETAAGWAGEPIMQYWFEQGDVRQLFQTRDKGAITSAWARLALRKALRSA